MTKPAAIAAQLVDIKNVATHKCVRLTIDVPAEQAMAVIETFGWPTMVDPVPVGIARLNTGADSDPLPPVAPVREAEAEPSSASRPHKPVAPEKRLAQQAGICCSDPVFWKFAAERYPEFMCRWSAGVSEEHVSVLVRGLCGVESRSEIKPNTRAGARWIDLHGQFLAWKMVPA